MVSERNKDAGQRPREGQHRGTARRRHNPSPSQLGTDP